ncbi:hypothetical protein JYU34_017468 [Plutella xylostella]|uniref:Moricin n=1 Tax=Plutella xylostella TaxID=51655 RepID=A0ABQ7Q1F0_PLUXY|nr:hypothetical protein JYU34_017468 [Plutella xylostella]
MRFFHLLMLALAAMTLLLGGAHAAPKVNVNALRKGGRVIRKGLGVIGAAGTAHEVYNHVRNRNQG